MNHKDRPHPRNFTTSLRASLKATFSPATAQLLQEAVKPEPDFKTIAAILKLDPALATAILSLVNSPYYGQTGKISNLQRAAIILGNDEILRIALSLSLQNNLNTILERNGFDTFANWRLIIWSALGAELVAERIIPKDKDTAYICALVKDLSLLLYAVTFPDHLLPHLTQPDFVNTGPTFMAWQRHLPTEHASLTADLLAEWNFPDRMVEAITAHHDLGQILDHPPLTQAVILGTRWAEVEFRVNPEPDSLGQLGFLLSKVDALPTGGLDHLRQRCVTLFGELCAAMNIKEQPPEDRLYTHSLQSIQDFHYQAKEVEGVTGGVAAVAACIARHLRWNWDCSDAEIVLCSPNMTAQQCYTLRDGKLLPPKPDMSCAGMNLPEAPFILEADSETYGEIRMPQIHDAGWNTADVSLYTRLLARSYGRYLRSVGQLELKAALLDILPAGIALLDAQGKIIRTNPMFSRHLEKDAFVGQLFTQCLVSNGLDQSQSGWLNFLRDPNQQSHCIVHCPLGPSTPPEHARCFSLTSYKFAIDQETTLLVLVQDLSDVRVLEVEALRQRDFLTHLLSSMQDLVLTTDATGVITFASGRHTSFLKGKNLFQLTRPLNDHAGPWDMDYLEQSPKAVEAQIVLDDEHLVLELIFSRFSHGTDHGLVVGRNISAIRRLERKIREQALFDSLTQVFNRHHLQPVLDREISRSRRTGRGLGMLFFDIDKFKTFNDTHGHHAGDKALRDLGQLMRGILRKGLDYPCRFGGDEFVIISSDATLASLTTIARRMQKEFSLQHNGQVSLSIGMSLLEPADTAQSLLERCDKANYQAKAQGGNAIVHLQNTTITES